MCGYWRSTRRTFAVDAHASIGSAMETTTHPIFALYVMWHPSYQGGQHIAEQLRTHFGRDLYQFVAEGRGSVFLSAANLCRTPARPCR